MSWKPRHSPWAIALTVTMATFMEVLDTSIANVALQHIAGSLSVDQNESTWVLTSYLVSNAIVLPISGWLATRLGRKRFYMTCVALFTVSSFLCGIAPNLGLLIFFRVLQGAGGGGLGPSEQSILADTFPPNKRGMAFAVYGMAVVLAPAIGPTLGGFITDHYSWRWVFFINVPVGIASLLLSHRMVEDPPYLARERKKLGKIDFPGIALIALGLGCLEVVLDKGQEDDWFASRFILVFATIAAVSLVAFVVWELTRKNPVVDVNLFRHRTFAAASCMMLVLGATLYGTTVLLPQFTQNVLGYTAQLAGEALSPGGLLVMAMMPMIGALVARVDARKLIALGFLISGASLFYMAHHIDREISFGVAVRLRMYQAAGLAFLFVPISTISYVGLPQEKYNQASGIINLARNMGGDIGIAALTTLLARRSQHHQVDLVAHTTAVNPTFNARLAAMTRTLVHSGASTHEAHRRALAALSRRVISEAATLSYMDLLWMFGVATLVMVPLTFLMKKNEPGKSAAPA
ncbi:MAG TPA: DHA2 family efflux MFS transporter permease subunit [Polyangiaceae bacterium]|nr:DHA2 family efflux MFS transporter permease subunit [Polyangiaceae bacterium]